MLAAMTSRHEDLVVSAPVDEVVAAIEAVDLKVPWRDVAPSLRIALPRRRSLPPGTEDLPTRSYPAGIEAGLGLDIGPAMLFVNHQQLADWEVTKDHAFDCALANVKARLGARNQFALLHERIAGVPSVAFQSREGWASSLLLLPDELARVMGERNGLILAPMRDLILMMPLDTDPELAYMLLDEFASADMNALDLPLFSLIDGELTQAIAGPEPTHSGSLHH